MKTFNLIFSLLFLFVSISNADVTGTKIQGPALIEGFNAVTSAAGTTTLTKDSQTKQILTGSTTQTFVLPDATTLPLSRKFLIINKSTGTATIQTSGGGALTIVSSGKQKEFHLRAAGSAAGTWDELDVSGGGGGAWGGITGTLSDQSDLQTALNAKAPTASPTFTGTIGTPLTASRLLSTDGSGNLSATSITTTTAGYLDPTSSVQTQLNAKAPLASPTFTGTIGTPLTASKLLATDASGNLTATAANSSQASYLDLTSSAQTQIDGKVAKSTLTTKGDIYVATGSATVVRKAVGADNTFLKADSAQSDGLTWASPSGAALAVVSKTTTYTATTSDDVILVTTGSAWTLTLYAASGNSGKILTIKKTSSDVNPLTIDGNASETIDGQTTTTINTQYESIRIICDGSNWHILERKIDESWQSYTPTGSWNNSTYAGKWRRNKDTMDVQIQVTLLSAPSASTLTVNLPSGYSIDTAKLANSTIYDAGLGIAHLRDFSGNFYTASTRYNNTTSVLFTVNAGGLITESSPFTWTSADQLSAQFSIPISGWKGN